MAGTYRAEPVAHGRGIGPGGSAAVLAVLTLLAVAGLVLQLVGC